MGNNFGEWLVEELNRRSWNLADLARKANTSGASISRVINGDRNPGPELCRSIAKALGYNEEYVFRKAGLLSKTSSAVEDQIEKLSLRELIDLFEKMTPDQREEIVDYAFWRWEQDQKRKKAQRRAKNATDPATGAA